MTPNSQNNKMTNQRSGFELDNGTSGVSANTTTQECECGVAVPHTHGAGGLKDVITSTPNLKTEPWEPSDLDACINSWLSQDDSGNDYMNEDDIENLRRDLKELFQAQKQDFLAGRLCHSCGEPKPQHPLIDICEKCLEED